MPGRREQSGQTSPRLNTGWLLWLSAEEKEAREEATQAFQAFQLNVLKQVRRPRWAMLNVAIMVVGLMWYVRRRDDFCAEWREQDGVCEGAEGAPG